MVSPVAEVRSAAAGWAGMWDHARLLRRVLLLVSVLTLSGLHVQQDQPPDGWRAVRLLPLTLSFLSVAANTVQMANNVYIGNAYKLMYSIVINTVVFNGTLMLVFGLYHRRRIHALLRDVAALDEATAVCRRPGDYRSVLLKTVLLCAIPVCSFSCWVFGFFAVAELKHPNYLSEWYIPEKLLWIPAYGPVIAAQVLSGFFNNAFQMSFDVLLVGLADSVTLLQERLGRYCHTNLNRSNTAKTRKVRPAHHDNDQVSAILWDAFAEKNISAVDGDTDNEITHYTKLPKLTRVGVMRGKSDGALPGGTDDLSESALRTAACQQELQQQDVLPDLELRLQQLVDTYASVRRLASDAASLCSLPTLSMHASVTAGLLLGTYVCILIYHNEEEGTGAAQVIGFAALSLAMVLRVLIVSFSGSQLIEQGEHLHQTLAEVRWPAAVPASLRFSMQLLLEQTRQPLHFDGWGLFTVQKSNMLALFSFVLTYFVILVQMKVG